MTRSICAKQGKPHYIEEQGAEYEGLDGVLMNSLVNSAGGQILSDNGSTVALNESAVVGARHDAPSSATSPAADPSLGQRRWRIRRGWPVRERARAAFELNYPYVYPSAKADVPDIFKNMAWTTYPGLSSRASPRASRSAASTLR